MRCCVPFCRSTADKTAGADEVSFHRFPLDVTICTKWLRALGIHDQPLKNSAVVCSQHFLDDDFCNIEGGLKQVRLGVVPSSVKLCIICLDTDRNVVSLRKYNLEDAYEKLTGHAISREGYLKQTLCIECVQHLINFEKFRSKSLKARSAMMDLVKMHETVTMRHLKQINYIRELLKSEIVETAFAPDHCEVHIKECSNGDVQTDSGNIVLPDANNAVKIEPYECTLDESDTGLKLEETNEDLNDERQDTAIFINNIWEMKLMDEPLKTEPDLDEGNKLECSVYSDDAYDGRNDDERHAECSSEECDTQLAHRTHTALHSHHRETNQVRAGDTSSDYPHTSVKLVPIQVSKLPSEKKDRVEKIKALSKNCVIESEPKGGETANFEISNMMNETELNFIEKVTGKLQVNNPIAVFDTLNKHILLQEYYCDHCKYKCSKRNKIVKHMKNHTIEERLSSSSFYRTCKRSSLVSDMKIDSVKKPFSCKLCKYVCRAKADLTTHMRIHTDEKPFSCKLCEYACRSQGNLITHMRIHTGEKPFSCKFCEYACRSQGNLVTHMRIHTGEKPFSCKLCEYACRSQGNLITHMRIHTGEKPFSCKLCEYACRMKGSLIRHMRIHSGEKPLLCKLCEYACRTKGDLVSHMRIHTDKKPFSCNICEFACRGKGDLVRHMRVHTGEKPFSCNVCEHASRRRGDLVRHMRIHSGDVEIMRVCEQK